MGTSTNFFIDQLSAICDEVGLGSNGKAGGVFPGAAAITDAYQANGGVQISVPAENGVKANDVDPGTITGFDPMSQAGGDVTMEPNGSFTYGPPFHFSGSLDAFTYRFKDSEGRTQTGYVGIDVIDPVWFIDESSTGQNLGSFNDPFQSIGDLSEVQGAPDGPGPGDPIVVFQGDYGEGIELLTGQTLLGKSDDVFVQLRADQHPIALFNRTVRILDRATLSSSSGDGIELADGNTIRGLDIGSTTGFGIFGSGFGDVTISDVIVRGKGGVLNFSDGTVHATFESVSSVDSDRSVIVLNSTAGSIDFGNTTLSLNSPGAGIDITSSSVNIDFGNLVVDNSGGPALVSKGDGRLTVSNGSLSGMRGAVDIERNDLGIKLGSVSSTGGEHGILLTDVTGFFTVTGTGEPGSGGSIENATGSGITVTGSLRSFSITDMRISNTVDGISVSGAESVTLIGIELESISTARHPWSVLVETPGRTDDGVNISNTTLNSEAGGVLIERPANGNTQKVHDASHSQDPPAIIVGNVIEATGGPGLEIRSSNPGVFAVAIEGNTISGSTFDIGLIEEGDGALALSGFVGGDSAAVAAFLQDANVGEPSVLVVGDIESGPAITAVEPISSETPKTIRLAQNYPNPFNPVTTIEFEIPERAFVSLTVFDVLGRPVSVLANQPFGPGRHQVVWDAARSGSGVYFYRLETAGFVDTKAMLLSK